MVPPSSDMQSSNTVLSNIDLQNVGVPWFWPKDLGGRNVSLTGAMVGELMRVSQGMQALIIVQWQLQLL